jgi:hypothetical protein
MLTRLRIALGLVLLLSLLTSTAVLAKGGFDFITIAGPDAKEAIHVTDLALTEDFFTFANFYEDRTEAPSDPGVGYEILRYYEEGPSARAFDRLHYYPESGYVFYDGLEGGGWSEYDDQWYTARPEIKPIFEAALAAPVSVAPVEKKQPVASVSGSQAESAGVPSTPAGMGIQVLPLILIVLAGGLTALAALAVLAFRRKPSTQ